MLHLRNRSALVIGVLAASVAGAAVTAPVYADVPAPQMRIAYGDLDLQSTQGRKILNRRVDIAARQVCEGNDDYGNHFAFNRCRDQARDGARKQLADAGVAAAL